MAKKLKKIVKSISSLRYSRLHSLKFGLAGGIVTGLCVFLTTLFATFGYCYACGVLLHEIYGSFGYTIGSLGALVGGLYGFIDGFIITTFFAWVYNKLI